MSVASPPRIDTRREGDALSVDLSGDWTIGAGIPSAEPIERELLGSTPPTRLIYSATGLGTWDTSLLAFLSRASATAADAGVPEDRSGLPHGVTGLMDLAAAVPEQHDASHGAGHTPLVVRIGLGTIEVTRGIDHMLEFLGNVTLALFRMLRGRASFRRSDFILALQQAGVEAMPIVALVAFLMGVIIAFVGAIQLQAFGATAYVADLVGIAMVRDVAALMTGIVMAGRSGAAYAAEIGSMNVNEEVDALTTIGVSPVEFLVLPRFLALVLMMPLLTLYADFVSIMGGMLVGITMLDQSFTLYVMQTTEAVELTHLVPGLIKGTTYGAIVALSGCLRGLQSGRSSLAVGAAATSAVVTAVVLMIAAAGVFSVLSYVLGI